MPRDLNVAIMYVMPRDATQIMFVGLSALVACEAEAWSWPPCHSALTYCLDVRTDHARVPGLAAVGDA